MIFRKLRYNIKLKISQMKKTYKLLAVIAVMAFIVASVSSCKTCDCPKWNKMESSTIIE